MNVRILMIALLSLAGAAAPAAAVTVRVGSGAGCDHATLAAALDALSAQPGTHQIRIRNGSYAIPDGLVYAPSVVQDTVLIEGGYAECTDPAPTGDPSSDAGRAVFDASGGAARPAFDLRLFGRVGSLQLRRIVVTGGDAFVGSDEFYNAGGGLAIRGRASVLLGRGATIRNNGAGRGGGVALIGSEVRTTDPVAKADLYVDEGAQITNNAAADQGGGIYCGGTWANASPDRIRHGSIVLVDGTIGFNSAARGGGFYCFGTVEGGGGFQPRPRAGAAAWIIGNRSTSAGGCGAGYATLDAAVPMGPDGWRNLGAAEGQSGMLAVTHNEGQAPGLCLAASFQLGSLSVPNGPSRFRLRNLHVAEQHGRGTLGLALMNPELAVRVEPAGPAVRCEFFAPVPCVSFQDNRFDPADPAPVAEGELIASQGTLELVRAFVTGNESRRSLIRAAQRRSRIESSVLTGNRVDASSAEPALGRSLFSVANAGTLEVVHTTALTDTPLDQFVRLDVADAAAVAQASIFGAVGVTAPVAVAGAAPPSRFTRRWCGFFQSTAGFESHTVIPDPTSGLFEVLPPGALVVNGTTFAPGADLIDRCTVSVERDFHGERFGGVHVYPESPPGDLGAVEWYDTIFRDGFE